MEFPKLTHYLIFPTVYSTHMILYLSNTRTCSRLFCKPRRDPASPKTMCVRNEDVD